MRNVFLFLLLAVVGTATLTAQPVGGFPRAKKIKLAEDKYKMGDPYSALEVYQELYDEDKSAGNKDTELLERLATLNFELRDYKEAEKFYDRLLKADKDNNTFPLARFSYARVLAYNMKYDEAIAEFGKFSTSYTGDHQADYQGLAANAVKGANMAKVAGKAPVSDVKIETAGSQINTPSSESAPVAVNRDEIVYSSLPADSVIVLKEGDEANPNNYSRIFKAKRTDKGWGEPVALGPEVNKPGFHTTAPSFSPNKDVMYYTRTINDANRPRLSKLFKSNYSGGSYTAGEPLNFNSDDYSCKQATIGSMDGKETIFFVSDMPGGKGGWDLWYAQKNSDGTFGTPLNMGDEVNTFGDEETPFFSEGTLYFSSTGHPSFGGYDLFTSKYNNAKWGSVENMGGSYNTSFDEFFFSIGEDPCYGFLVSNRPGTVSMKKSSTCCDDIFTLTMPARCPVDVTVKTFDISNNNPLTGCTITLYDAATNKKIDEQTNVSTNNVTFKLDRGMDYKLVATKNGFIEGTTTVSTKTTDANRPASLEAKLVLDPRAEVIVKTYDVKTRQPLSGVDVVLYDKSGKEVTRKNNAAGNDYKFDLVNGQSYKLTGNKANYAGDFEEFDTKKKTVDLYLGLPLFDTIFYDFDKSNIRPDAAAILDNKIIQTLRMYPGLVVEVGSHTDAKGTDVYNEKLSENRTNAALAYLAAAGISKERLLPKWYGEAVPAAPNEVKAGVDYPKGRQTNRRTVFKIVRGLEPLDANSGAMINIVPDAVGNTPKTVPAPEAKPAPVKEVKKEAAPAAKPAPVKEVKKEAAPAKPATEEKKSPAKPK